jgi:hypothetical protein
MSPGIEIDEILNDPVVVRFLKDHPDVEPMARSAAQKLVGKSDALEAVIKVLPALESNTVKVFLSYKKKR